MMWFGSSRPRYPDRTPRPGRRRPKRGNRSLRSIGGVEVFYGLDSEIVSEGLADLLEKAAPYMGGAAASAGGLADLHPRDEDITTLGTPCERDGFSDRAAEDDKVGEPAMNSCARAAWCFLCSGICAALAAAECLNEFEVFGRELLIVLGRPAVPILVAALRERPCGTRSSHRFWTSCKCCRARRSWLRGCALPVRIMQTVGARSGITTLHYRALIPSLGLPRLLRKPPFMPAQIRWQIPEPPTVICPRLLRHCFRQRRLPADTPFLP